MRVETRESSLQAVLSASRGCQENKSEVLFGSGSGELLGSPDEVNFPGGFFGSGLPLIVQIDDKQVGGKSPVRVLAIVVDLHPGDVF